MSKPPPDAGPQEWDASKYHQVSEPQVAWGKAVLERLSRIGLRGDEVIVDAGCGTGRLTAELLERWPNAKVVAIDASRNMLDAATQHLRRFGSRVTFRCVDLQDWQEKCVADVVFSTATFHWIKDHPKLFANVYRALRPGGWICAQCGGGPNLAVQHARADMLRTSEPFRDFFDGWVGPWEFASAEVTRRRLLEAGFLGVEADVEPAPVAFAEASLFREFVTTVILRPYLAHLAGELRERFVDRITDMAARDDPPFVLDYWRLNLQAQRR